MGTFGVIVERYYRKKVCQRAYLLSPGSGMEEWESAISHAISRCLADQDIAWTILFTPPAKDTPQYLATIDESMNGEELVGLLTTLRDNPNRLTPDEKLWIDDLIVSTQIASDEISLFLSRLRRVRVFGRAAAALVRPA